MKRNLIILGIVGLSVLGACKRKGCIDEKATNFDSKAKKDDGSCVMPTNTYNIPTTYAFKDKEGNNTVNYSGQKERLDMLTEIADYLKTANTKGTVLDASQLKNMYANSNYTWIDANNLGMTGSTKQLKDKTAGDDAAITSVFEAYMDSIAAISALNQDGSTGVAGVYPETGGKGPYLMSATGIEYAQLIEKGLMGAVFYYNIVNVYLQPSKMDVDNSSAVDADNSKYYTTMEHHWDEAFGYFTSEIDFPTNGTDRFWGKYAQGREDLLGSSTKIMDAFLKGRAAISNDDLTTRDAQITIIQNEMEKMIAGTAIHYINQSISNITNNTVRNHALSEAKAFIDGLKYGATNKISKAEIKGIIDTIGYDFNSVTIADLQSAKDQISSLLGLDDVKDLL